MGENIDLPELMAQLGEFGPYQLKQHCLHGLAWLLAGIHMMSFVFVFPVVEHRCHVKELDEYHYSNIEINDHLQIYIPRSSNGKFESCLKYDNFNGTVQSCDKGYIYDYTIFHSSRLADWDMVCEKTWMRALLQSSFLFGCLVGSVVCGYLADIFGRKPVYCISGAAQLIFGIASAFQQNYYALLFSMFWYGLFGGTACVICSVALTMELVGAKKRSLCSTMFTVWFDLGSIMVATWAYFLIVDAKILQLIFATHSIFLLGHYWFMDESICWLWANNKREKALEIAVKAINYNGREFKNGSKSKNESVGDNFAAPTKPVETKATSSWDLFRYPKLRKRTLVMLYCWFASALSYFGLSFNSVNLVGNPYLMFIINVIVEIPGHFISIFLVTKTGNKPMFSMSLFTTGLACILVPGLPEEGMIVICITMIAKIAATVTFNVINSYTAELFPTSVRNTGLGLCMMVARGGAAVIPQINLLASKSNEYPTMIIGIIGVLASFCTMFMLPETMNKKIPQTVEDVEKPAETIIL